MTARMNKWDARFALHGARNRGELPNTWARFEYLNAAANDVRRALWGIDGPNAYCGDRNNRLRRYILAAQRFDVPRLP